MLIYTQGNKLRKKSNLFITHGLCMYERSVKHGSMSTNMEKRNLGYLLKNIPIISKNAYMKKLMDKVESVEPQLRRKVIFFENENACPSKTTYGFKTNKAPDKMELLNPFENDLYYLVSNIQFNPRRNTFQ